MTAGKHRPVSAAEKYAELAAKGEERPNCKCHEKPARWNARPNPLGGSWRCAVTGVGLQSVDWICRPIWHEGEDRPRCSGHGEPMSKNGGKVQCSVKLHERRQQWNQANPGRANKRSREWREANHERALESERRWRAANAEKANERSRRWYKANREKAVERARRWREANPEKHAEAVRKHKNKPSSILKTMRRDRLRKAKQAELKLNELLNGE